MSPIELLLVVASEGVHHRGHGRRGARAHEVKVQHALQITPDGRRIRVQRSKASGGCQSMGVRECKQQQKEKGFEYNGVRQLMGGRVWYA